VTPIPIPFGAWEPDRATFQSDALTDCLNTIPVAGGYGPSNGFQSTEADLAVPILGAAVLGDNRTQVFIYAGSDEDVHVSNNAGPFASVYASGTSISDAYRWVFTRFVGKAIGVHPQVVPIGGDLGLAMTTLGDTPPLAKAVGVVGNFLVLGDLDDGIDGLRPNRIRWSGFRNPDTWGTSIATQADFNDMPDDGGVVQGIVGREFGTIFQRYAISRMTYVGPPTIFQFDVVERKRGAISMGSIIDAGLLAAYIADDGFFLWDGTSSTPIGSQRVNEYFRTRLYTGFEEKIVGSFDPLTASLSWAYPTTSDGILNERLFYSLTENRWSRSDLSGSWFMSGFDTGSTLEQLDSFGTLDSLPFSLDDPTLFGGRARSVGFDTDGFYGPLNGDTLAATLETGDWQSAPGKRSFVNAVRPQIDADQVTCAVGARQQSLYDPLGYTPDSPKVLDGRCPLRSSGRFMRFRMNVPGMQTWRRTTGIEASVAGEGRR
jgi:hypothetical protein